MTFALIFFMLAGVWLGSHLWFGSVNNELWDTLSIFRDEVNPMLWFSAIRTIITYEYGVFDTNWFFQILRGVLIIAGIAFYMVVVVTIIQTVSHIFSGITQMLSGFRRGIR